MTLSQSIAGLIGPTTIAISIFVLFRREAFTAFVEQSAQSRPAIFLCGLIFLICGIELIQIHNLWVLDWRVLITIFGWLLSIDGFILIVFPDFYAPFIQRYHPENRHVIIEALVSLALGVFLIAKAYSLI